MRGGGSSLKTSLCRTLATSRVGAVAIAVLLFDALLNAFYALWGPLSALLAYLIDAILILRLPFHPPGFTFQERMLLTTALFHSINSVIAICAGSLLSRWVYGAGPIRALRTYTAILNGRNNA